MAMKSTMLDSVGEIFHVCLSAKVNCSYIYWFSAQFSDLQ